MSFPLPYECCRREIAACPTGVRRSRRYRLKSLAPRHEGRPAPPRERGTGRGSSSSLRLQYKNRSATSSALLFRDLGELAAHRRAYGHRISRWYVDPGTTTSRPDSFHVREQSEAGMLIQTTTSRLCPASASLSPEIEIAVLTAQHYFELAQDGCSRQGAGSGSSERSRVQTKTQPRPAPVDDDSTSRRDCPELRPSSVRRSLSSIVCSYYSA
jgi:hypothetical protein